MKALEGSWFTLHLEGIEAARLKGLSVSSRAHELRMEVGEQGLHPQGCKMLASSAKAGGPRLFAARLTRHNQRKAGEKRPPQTPENLQAQ